jgi:hypothetical protein
VNNLTDKVKKGPLKKNLAAIFAPFGRVLDIVHCRTERLRGQAWLVFDSVAAASSALKQLQGFPLYDKPMVRAAPPLPPSLLPSPLFLTPPPPPSHPPPHTHSHHVHPQRLSFAREKSHAVEKLEGTFQPRAKRPREAPKAPPKAKSAPGAKRARKEDGGAEAGGGGGGGAAPGAFPAPPAMPLLMVPSRTLLVQGLPTTLTAAALSDLLRSLFGQFAGMNEVRPVAQRGLAFIEFASEAAAAPALQGLHNFKLDAQTTLVVSYART